MFGSDGLVEVYTGDGKGKTTAALGLMLRVSGHGGRTALVQFMKGSGVYGEQKGVSRVPDATLVVSGRDRCISKDEVTGEDIAQARDALEKAKKFIVSGEYDLVILDEINVAVDFGLVSATSVVDVLRAKAPRTEVVLTGRYAPRKFIEEADLVSEVNELKHPYRRGITSRKGVDY